MKEKEIAVLKVEPGKSPERSGLGIRTFQLNSGLRYIG